MTAIDTLVEPPGQLELVPVAPGVPCTSYRVVSFDPTSGSDANPRGVPRWSDTVRDLPTVAGRAGALAAELGDPVWIVGADHTSCEVDPFGNVTPPVGWALRVSRFLTNRRDPSPMTTTATAPTTVELNLDQLVPHPDNVRRHLGDLTDMAKSIAAKGVLEPMLVLPAGDDGKHLVVAGHRRLAAAHKAKYTGTILCVIRDLTEVEVLETMLVENLQRAEITPIEEARAYGRLVELDTNAKAIARKVGRSEALVKSRLALLVLPAKVLDLVDAGKVTLGTAEGLTKWADDDDAMTWFADKYKGGGAIGNPAYLLGHYIEQRDRDREIDAHKAKVAEQGLKAWTPSDRWWSMPHSLTLSKQASMSQLGTTVAKHKAEPCHRVFVGTQGGSRKIERLHICIDPKRHTTKVPKAKRSELQIEPSLYAADADVSEEEAARKAAQKIRNRAEERHRQALPETIASIEPGDGDLISLALYALNSAVGYGPTRGVACELLRLPPTVNNYGGTSTDGGWDEYIADPANHPRALAALAAAKTSAASYRWASGQYATLLEFLLHHGYEPEGPEHELIEQAFAERQEELAEDAAERATVKAEADELERAQELPLDERQARIAELTAAAEDLDDGPELDEVNAELAKLLDLAGQNPEDD